MYMLAFVLFFLLANPVTFKMTRRAVSGLASPEGLPTSAGLLVHALVFVLLSRFIKRRFSRYVPGVLHPGELNGGTAGTPGYISLTHQHKQK